MQFWKSSSISSIKEERKWERWRIIFNILEDQHVASIKELLIAMDCRKSILDEDIEALCAAGLIKRTARNAITLEDFHPEKSLEERAAQNQQAKAQIAGLVVEKYLRPEMTIFVDASTTVKAIAPYIANMKLRVITNCLSLIYELRKLEFQGETICTGGTYRSLSNSVVGTFACNLVKTYSADFALLGTEGISPNMEIMEAHPEEALLKRCMMQNAKRTLVLALPTKFGDASLLPVASLSKVDAIVSTSFPDSEFVTKAKGTGVRLECPA